MKDRLPRADYEVAAAKMRAARDRLQAGPRSAKTTTSRDIVVWVIVQFGSYSRTFDEVKRRDIAAALGVDVKTVSRALRWAADQGVIGWRSNGPGDA